MKRPVFTPMGTWGFISIAILHYASHNHKWISKHRTECTLYSAVNGFWPVEELAEVADGSTGCGEMARAGCSFAWNFSVTRSTVLTEAERGCRCVSDSLLAYGLKIPPIRNRALNCTVLNTCWYECAVHSVRLCAVSWRSEIQYERTCSIHSHVSVLSD